jgi:hypothetical protein
VSHGQNVTVDVMIGSKCHYGCSELGCNIQAAAAAGGGGNRQHTGRENLEEFRTTENLAWASGNNSYSLDFHHEANVILMKIMRNDAGKS